MAQIDQRAGNAGAGLGGEDQTCRILAVAHGQRDDLDADVAVRDGGADLQHVGFQDAFLARDQVVGVILVEAGALGALHALGHDLHQADHTCGLPVALGAEAVSLLHQALDCKTRQLLQGSQIAEVGDDGLIILLLQEALEADLDLRLRLDVTAELIRVPALQEDLVGVVVLVGQCLDFRVGDGIHCLADLVDRISVDLPAELDLCFNLIALGDGDVSHVVSDTHDADVAGLHDADSGAHPGSETAEDLLILPVAHDDLPLDAHAGHDVAVLTVAVGGLVLIHVVHVDGVVGDLLQILGVQVAQGLFVLLKAEDPGLGRGEGVHPGDHARTVLIAVRLVEGSADRSIVDQGGLPHDFVGQDAGSVHVSDHLSGMFRNVAQALIAVQILGTCAKPEAIIFHNYYDPFRGLRFPPQLIPYQRPEHFPPEHLLRTRRSLPPHP